MTNNNSSLNKVNKSVDGAFEDEFAILNKVKNKPETDLIEKSSDLNNGEAILYDNSNDLYLYS